MKAWWSLTRAGLKSIFRNRTALFFTFFFPIMFILIFGSMYNRDDNKDIKFSIRVVMLDSSPSVSWVPKVFENKKLGLDSKIVSISEAEADLDTGNARAVVIFPANFAANYVASVPTRIQVLTDATQQQASAATAGIIKEVVSSIEHKMVGREALLQIDQSAHQTGKNELPPLKGIDFILPGILAMTIMQLGLFTAAPIILMREKGILKRLQATPLPRITIILSQISQRLVLVFTQTFVIIGLGVVNFGFSMRGNWFSLIGLIIFAVVTFISVGTLIASVAKTVESGMAMVQLVNLPMMFLSGLFFPAELLPKFMAPLVKAIPATYLADLLRNVMTETPLKHPAYMDLGIMACWLGVCLFLSARMFKWD